MRALFVLTTTESKRLIGKAVAEMEEVKWAKEHSKMLIGHGATNVYVAEEIMGKEEFAKIIKRDCFLSGVIMRGNLCTISGEEKPPLLILNKGAVEPPAPTMSELLYDFREGSVIIKGANCVDPQGKAAAFVGHPEGGTLGWAIGTILARGICTIVPVGLEKLVSSVDEAVKKCGHQTFDYCQGMRVGLIPLTGAKIVTEIEALKILTGVETTHVASGGNSGSEGAVTLVSEGDKAAVEKAIQIVESIKGEEPVRPRKGICLNCVPSSPAQSKNYQYVRLTPRCHHEGKKEEQLPSYLRNR